MVKKILIVAEVRPIIDQWLREEISYSRMVEMLNEVLDRKVVLKEDLEADVIGLESNVGHILMKFNVDRNYDYANYKINEVFKEYKKKITRL